MACACKKNVNKIFVWTSLDGTQTQEYPTEVQAKAKVIRKGGSYEPVAKQ